MNLSRGWCVICIVVLFIACLVGIFHAIYHNFNYIEISLIILLLIAIWLLFKRASKLYDKEIGIDKIKKYANEVE